MGCQSVLIGTGRIKALSLGLVLGRVYREVISRVTRE